MTERPLLMRPPAAAKRLGVSEKMLRELVRQHRLKCVIVGRRKMFTEADLVRFTEEAPHGRQSTQRLAALVV